MDVHNDQWIEKALEVHSIISLKISSQFLLHGDDNAARKKCLKEVLVLIDQLDFLLESMSTQQETYQKSYAALFVLLQSLGLDGWAIRALKRRFGSGCLFVLLQRLGLEGWAIRALKRRFGSGCLFVRQALQALESVES